MLQSLPVLARSIGRRAPAFARSVAVRQQFRCFSVSSLKAAELKYTKSHEWVKLDNKTATLGISAHAQEELGEIVYVDLPEVGSEYKAGDSFGAVESVKAAADVYSPLAGKVIGVNDTLSSEPSLVNSSPTDKGWMIKIEVGDSAPFKDLMDQKAYDEYVKESAH
ncbi:hypothetical protein GUITHDRAFT_88499 [Guillardia theta CCMP2712]|uniref:Glycine cleavage system H protein n=2 Tax=Eukaryota TaxID=2759 RepID=L1IZQ4_GUITC|nr:hypothetical protein GUITHDRAFT_88499 [Guillardia theta CCMP2712]EKX41280.1 hypothetical protein GUITHDRAFT_88499 [Guillardia theta CCMP2712]|mmetsp:Transcript_21404/g.70912  ORF Transcript_21404/g.70912 Transcript_21404/m.70912 type:complete len:165 (-) Transcript_21404:147-641(-)|eukprot:XP_005828260.1 hypothetical protein GUITHDRAFT_88499 [Guillardia theta CCMP2712]